tara:strand:+ start:17174 stop:17557 length:384 start_codon:yes stop_codon:yes gene_type:complete
MIVNDKQFNELIKGGLIQFMYNIRPILEDFLKSNRRDIYEELSILRDDFMLDFNLGDSGGIEVRFESHDHRSNYYGYQMELDEYISHAEKQRDSLQKLKEKLDTIIIGKIKFGGLQKIEGTIQYEIS